MRLYIKTELLGVLDELSYLEQLVYAIIVKAAKNNKKNIKEKHILAVEKLLI